LRAEGIYSNLPLAETGRTPSFDSSAWAVKQSIQYLSLRLCVYNSSWTCLTINAKIYLESTQLVKSQLSIKYSCAYCQSYPHIYDKHRTCLIVKENSAGITCHGHYCQRR